ncbi:MAG TPA: FABP family protein [Jatrophihabitantaceae bacterium]|jgi:hypothetical protein|nr:FABP family protein [Jatrophihabitantaceae bacterium]
MTQPTPDTADLRSGSPINDALLSLLPLVGVWRGAGTGLVPGTQTEFSYGQQMTFVHDGRPFLAYEARSWLFDEDGAVMRQAWRESGFWRVGAGDNVEAVIASNTGQALVFAGLAGDQRWELATTSAEHAPTAMTVSGERRLYALVDGALAYATELAVSGPYAPHLNARLERQPV